MILINFNIHNIVYDSTNDVIQFHPTTVANRMFIRQFPKCTVTKLEVLRYLKGIYTNKERFIARFITPIETIYTKNICEFFIEMYDDVKSYSYREAFEINDQLFRSIVFGSINITDMIESLGCQRVKVSGIPVKRKQFSKQGDFIGYKEYDNIYETYLVNGNKLLTGALAAIKCWCTSTNKEHWLWIDIKYIDDPLAAIASTFRIHKNVIPHIKELKRQGDIMLVELKKEIEPKGEVRSLTTEEYFGLLSCES